MIEEIVAGAMSMVAETEPIDTALLERWALAYLGRYASSAENLRRVLQRRVRRLTGDEGETRRGAALIDALVERYRAAGLLDDAVYAAGRARGGLARGRSMRQITAGLRAKGVGAERAAAAVAALCEEHSDPELVAACSFARRRRLGPYRRGAADRKRELAAFARAGFERRIAETVLACGDAASVEALIGDGASDGEMTN